MKDPELKSPEDMAKTKVRSELARKIHQISVCESQDLTQKLSKEVYSTIQYISSLRVLLAYLLWALREDILRIGSSYQFFQFPLSIQRQLGNSPRGLVNRSNHIRILVIPPQIH